MAIDAFELHRPESLEEALALLGEHGDDATLHAGEWLYTYNVVKACDDAIGRMT